MDFDDYTQVRRWKRDINENRWLYTVLEERPKFVLSLLDDDKTVDEVESEAYLKDFVDRMSEKAFARNLERMMNGELDDSEISKMATSCLTHLFIEAESNPVPDSAFSRVHTQLNSLFSEDYESVKQEWETILTE